MKSFDVLLTVLFLTVINFFLIESRSAGDATGLARSSTGLESNETFPDLEEPSDLLEALNNSKVDDSVGDNRNSRASGKVPDEKTCRVMEAEADKSFKKLLMIGEDLVVPRNESELQVYCKHGKSAMKIATSVGKCLKPFPRQVLGIIIRGGKKSLREQCDTSKGRSEILKHLECVTPDTSQIFYNSLEHGFRRLDYIAVHVKDEELLSTLCCTFHLIYNQTLDLVRHHCSKSPDSTSKFIRSIVDNIAKDVLDLGCSKWSSLDSCDNQLPQIMATLRSISPPDKNELEKRFLIGPIVTIASRLVA